MSRRLKQIIYGILYLSFVGLFSYGFYISTFKPPASCFDKIRNQDEVEVDCGGLYCEDCAIRHLIPIKIADITFVPGGDDKASTAVITFQNQNSAYGSLSFTYHIDFSGHVEEGEAFIYPSEIKNRVLVNLPFSVASAVSHIETITDVQWTPTAQLSVPKTQVRTVKFESDDAGRAVITGIVRNISDFPILTSNVNGYLTDVNTKKIVAASKTVVQDVAPGEERFFQILVPLQNSVDVASVRATVSVEAKR